ncbi:MAG: shikimate kinase [Prolixibacteraceae bacterium]|nr:shikimate kinase [Prolixibacteraceae bacterium]MBN2650642.1 shikimate kinase [Prolixibacteraceae bacterium]
MRIFLIGYMGSGKSTVGKGLAKNLNLSFIDMDEYIEERNMRTIPQIFEQDGESGFRNIERKALLELADFENVVIGTGGGAPCFFDNMDVIKKSGKSVYLKGTPRILAERLRNSKVERPLIKGKNDSELLAFINESLDKREKWYMQADVVLEFDHDLSDGEVLKAVVS